MSKRIANAVLIAILISSSAVFAMYTPEDRKSPDWETIRREIKEIAACEDGIAFRLKVSALAHKHFRSLVPVLMKDYMVYRIDKNHSCQIIEKETLLVEEVGGTETDTSKGIFKDNKTIFKSKRPFLITIDKSSQSKAININKSDKLFIYSYPNIITIDFEEDLFSWRKIEKDGEFR